MNIEDEKKRVGLKIRELREERKYTQDEFARMIDVSSQTVSNWELGKSTPDMIDMARLAKKLQISLDRFTDLQASEIESKLRKQEVRLEDIRNQVLRCVDGLQKDIYQLFDMDKE